MGLTFGHWSFFFSAADAGRIPATEAKRKAASTGRSSAGRFMGDTSEKSSHRKNRRGKKKSGPSKERAALVSVRFHGKIHQEHFPA